MSFKELILGFLLRNEVSEAVTLSAWTHASEKSRILVGRTHPLKMLLQWCKWPWSPITTNSREIIWSQFLSFFFRITGNVALNLKESAKNRIAVGGLYRMRLFHCSSLIESPKLITKRTSIPHCWRQFQCHYLLEYWCWCAGKVTWSILCMHSVSPLERRSHLGEGNFNGALRSPILTTIASHSKAKISKGRLRSLSSIPIFF